MPRLTAANCRDSWDHTPCDHAGSKQGLVVMARKFLTVVETVTAARETSWVQAILVSRTVIFAVGQPWRRMCSRPYARSLGYCVEPDGAQISRMSADELA